MMTRFSESRPPALIQRLFISPLLAILCLVNVASAQGLPPGVRVSNDVPYGRESAATCLDLYLPAKARTPAPVVIWIHGGGWEMGGKEAWPAIFLVDKGYAVASINYRLTGEAKFPAQIHDVKAAVRWLRANAKKFNLDPDHFGAWGSSAGGHLAALLGTSGDVRVLEGPARTQFKTSSRIQAVVDWCGPSDVEKWTEFQASFAGLDADYPNQGVARLLGGPIENKRDLAQKANPITFISDKTPPFLIMHGDRDELVPLSQSELLEAALKKAGVPVELHVIRGARHEMFNDHANLRLVEKFFDKALRTADKRKQMKGDEVPKLLATYDHQAGDAAPGPVEFYSNGRLISPDDINTWTLSGDKLVLCWYDHRSPTGVWVDTCVLDRQGKVYQGDRVRGVLNGQGNLRAATTRIKARR